MKRLSWDDYFSRLADDTSLRSTCDRAHVGAVLVSETNQILATGYNGSLAGQPHCTDAGHLMLRGHCVRTVHAEANAIIQCSLNGVSTKNSTIYVTYYPCLNCAKLLIQAGISTVKYLNPYDTEQEESLITSELFSSSNVKVCELKYERKES